MTSLHSLRIAILAAATASSFLFIACGKSDSRNGSTGTGGTTGGTGGSAGTAAQGGSGGSALSCTYNGQLYDSAKTLFTDDRWHCVEAQFILNSVDATREKPVADGIVHAWFDGELVIDKTDVVFRSADFPAMKFNQLLLTPHFGPGLLPHEQTLWIDELSVSKKR